MPRKRIGSAGVVVTLAALSIVAISASANTIVQFDIVTASDLSLAGGQFNDGGMFGGTFSVDLSSLPTGNGFALLPTVAVATTAGDSSAAPQTYTSGEIVDAGIGNQYGTTLEAYLLQFSAGSSNQVLTMEFFESPGTFTGGQVAVATEMCVRCGLGSQPRVLRQDISGDAFAIDPPPAVGEPGSAASCALGLVAVCLMARRSGVRSTMRNIGHGCPKNSSN